MAALNRMVDQWAAEGLMMYSLVRTVWTIVSGTQDYTLFTGGTINVARPSSPNLMTVAFQDTSTNPDTEYPLYPLTDAAYAGIRMKGLTSVFPQAWYLRNVFPQAIVSLFPIPTSSTLQGVLYAPQPIAAFAGLTTSVDLPPGYAEAVITNLAVNLASSYSRQIDQTLFQRAVNAKALIKRSNSRLSDLQFSADSLIGNGGGSWDIYSGP